MVDDKLIIARDPSTLLPANVGDSTNNAVRVNIVAGGGGGGGAVTIADGADVAEGATTDAAITSDTTGTLSAKLRGLVKWAFERMPASLGQKLSAASLPVVIASDQSAISISGSVTTGGLTDAQLRASAVPVSASQSGTWNIGTVSSITNPVAVTGTFWQATQPVSGTVTANQGGSPWSIRPDGTIWALTGTAASVNFTNTTIASTQSGTWTVQPGNTPNTVAWKVDGSSVTQPVSGTVSVSSITNALPSGTNNIGDVDVSSITGTGTIGAAQVSVTTSSAQVVAARAGRRSLLIVNHGTTDVYLGAGTVTTANGILLPGTKGASISIPTAAAVNGIVGSGTQTVSYIEVY